MLFGSLCWQAGVPFWKVVLCGGCSHTITSPCCRNAPEASQIPFVKFGLVRCAVFSAIRPACVDKSHQPILMQLQRQMRWGNLTRCATAFISFHYPYKSPGFSVHTNSLKLCPGLFLDFLVSSRSDLTYMLTACTDALNMTHSSLHLIP